MFVVLLANFHFVCRQSISKVVAVILRSKLDLGELVSRHVAYELWQPVRAWARTFVDQVFVLT